MIQDLLTGATLMDLHVRERMSIVEPYKTADYTFTYAAPTDAVPFFGDAGRLVVMFSGTTRTLTVPPNSSARFAKGTLLHCLNVGTASMNLAEGSGVTIPNIGSAVPQYGLVTFLKLAINTWYRV